LLVFDQLTCSLKFDLFFLNLPYSTTLQTCYFFPPPYLTYCHTYRTTISQIVLG
jgi:hypothetical protein